MESALPQTLNETFLDGGGAMADAIRAYDWASNPLGPIAQWPAALKIVVGLMLNSKFPKCVVWGPNLITLFNDAFRQILGDKPEALGRSFRSVWQEAWDYIGPIAEKAYAGEGTFIKDFPLVIDRYGYPEQAYFTFCYSPIRDETGHIGGMIDTVMETTDTVEAEKNAQLLNDELAHRVKNTLAIVGALVDQTFRSADSKEEAAAVLSSRIVALGRAQDILTQSSWSGAQMRSVIEGTLSAVAGENRQISIEGPAFMLGPKQALTLALAVNELATNATKYGALSVKEGRVTISWQIGIPSDEDVFRFAWVERNGPTISEPGRRGLGSRLIEHAFAEDFCGTVRMVFEPKGLTCELTAKLSDLQSRMKVGPAPGADARASTGAAVAPRSN